MTEADVAAIRLAAAVSRLVKEHLDRIDDPRQRVIAASVAMGVAVDCHMLACKEHGWSESACYAASAALCARVMDYAGAGDIADGAIATEQKLDAGEL